MDTRRHSGFVLQYGVDPSSTPESPQTPSMRWQSVNKHVATLSEVKKVQTQFQDLARKQNAWLTHKPNCSPVSPMSNYLYHPKPFGVTPPASDTSSICDDPELDPAFQSCYESSSRPGNQVLMFNPERIERASRLMQREYAVTSLEEAYENFRQSLLILARFAWAEISLVELLFIILDSTIMLSCLWYLS